jgi:glucose/mannose transport system permease protein
MIPLVQIFVGTGLNRTIYALVISHIIYGISIVTLIFRNFYAQIPNELIEAARVDGAGMFTTYFRIILPLSWPAFIVVLIWQFTSAWNDFLFAAFLT